MVVGMIDEGEDEGIFPASQRTGSGEQRADRGEEVDPAPQCHGRTLDQIDVNRGERLLPEPTTVLDGDEDETDDEVDEEEGEQDE